MASTVTRFATRDEEWETLVETASAQLSLSRGELLRWFGQQAMPHLARA